MQYSYRAPSSLSLSLWGVVDATQRVLWEVGILVQYSSLDRAPWVHRTLVIDACISDATGHPPDARLHGNQATYNNTIVTVTDCNGDTVNWSSCGTVGFKVRHLTPPSPLPRPPPPMGRTVVCEGRVWVK